MSERLEKIAGIISWIQNMSKYGASFGDVAEEFDVFGTLTKEEFYEAKKLLQKKSYVGSYDPSVAWDKRIAAFKKEMGDNR